MPFGMKSAPAIFQREMQRVFLAQLGKAVLVFIDDILIYTKTVEEHEEVVRWLLARLCEEGYYANPDKCEFFMKEVSFLGHVHQRERHPRAAAQGESRGCVADAQDADGGEGVPWADRLLPQVRAGV